jgi:ribose transport system substrate-binding protein
LTTLGGAAWWTQSHRLPEVPTIAFVPQTAGAMLWEVGHFGATTAAEKLKCRLYWNAPTSENDVAGQVSLVDRVGRGKYQGLVLAPNHPFAILAGLRRALAAGLPIVIVSAPLEIPSGSKLGYIVNDDEQMGELAANEVARLIHGKGSVALVGLARYTPGVTLRARGAERFLSDRFPDIHIVGRLAGANNVDRAEELTTGLMNSHPGLKAFLSLTATSTRGTHAALKSRSPQESIQLVGCEQDSDLMTYLGNGEIAAIVAEDSYRMGYEAVGLISASWAGRPIPSRSVVPPMLITKQNFNSEKTSFFVSFPR